MALAQGNLVIADSKRPVALAGIMGGLDSEIADATTTVLLESARFQPVNIRRSCRATGKSSDSSYRFERGVDLGDGLVTAEDGGESIILTDPDGRPVYLDTSPPERLYS